MQETQDWEERFDAELRSAAAARAAGNEGRSRVCARRAAGIAIGEYFRRQGIDFNDPSAVEKLYYLENLPGLPDEVRNAARLLQLRVTPEHALPVEADLIAEARRLAQALLRK